MPQAETETRQVHTVEAVSRVSSFQKIVDEHLGTGGIVVAPPDDRVETVLPESHGQQPLPGLSSTSYPSGTETHVTTLPTTSEMEYDLETDAYRHGTLVMPPTNGYHRARPFLDLIRVIQPGGTAISLCGIQDDPPADANAKFWIPASKQATLERVYAIERCNEQMGTPDVAGVFSVDGSSDLTEHAEASGTAASNQMQLREVGSDD